MEVARAAYVAVFALATLISGYGAWRATDIADRDTRLGLVSVFVLAGGGTATTTIQFAIGWVSAAAWLRIIGLIVGLASIGAWLYFASAYAGHEYHRRPVLRRLAVGLYLVAVAIKLTNPTYNLYFTTYVSTEPFTHLAFNPGVTYWLIAGGAYLSVGIATVWLIEAVSVSRLKDWRLGVVVVLTAVPAVVDVAIGLGRVPTQLVDTSYAPLGMAVFALGSFVFLNETFRPIPRFWRKQVLTHLNEATIIVDAEGEIRHISPSAAETFDELRGASETSFADTAPALYECTLQDDPIFEWETDSGTRYYRVIETGLPSERVGAHRAYVYTEVTGSEQTRRELHRKSRVMDKAPIGITIFDLHRENDPLVYANNRFDELAQNDLENRSDLTAVFCNGKDSEMASTVQTAVEEGRSVTIERCDDQDDQPRFWTKETFAPITDTEGKVSEFAGFHRDVTEDKEKQERLKQYKSAVEASPTWIFCIDSSERLVFANENFRQYYELDPSRVRGTRIDSIVEKSTAEKIRPPIRQALDGESVVFELEADTSKDERQRFVRAVLSPLWDDDGGVTGVVGSVHDLSEVRQREQQLQVLDRVLRHNIKNTMNVVRGSAELIEQQTSAPEVINTAETVSEHSKKLIDMAGKIRQVTKVLSKPRKAESTDLTQASKYAVSNAQIEHSEAEITLDTPDEPVNVPHATIETGVKCSVESAEGSGIASL
ncbi:signal-transducing histidine kinase/response regulator [Halorubrum californiense DSM 19288]|uniref:Signal-transducing histidine kinase/response regulator n=1 Tax=Halorubrum californiense DSM 19288 TaxID=1227465 RepID=M0E5R7_9EURY|nr:PAS domain-containing protein [Halorubrum californiense]ELZ42398.1 signal-transducing histidine kinase/response regulator [Halorubrum californiense DSM 19288]